MVTLFIFEICWVLWRTIHLTSLFPIVVFETMARTRLQTNRRFRDDG